jgi:hypothetical protein
VTVVETLLVFVGAPLAIVVLLALLIFLPAGRTRTRYRPGQPWEHEPVWYEPHPEHAPVESHGAGTTALASSVYPDRPALGSGEAHGRHSTSGATAAAPARAAGPLGGARGTW